MEPLFEFWAKSGREGEPAPMHSVPHHSLDVAASAMVLLSAFPPPVEVPATTLAALMVSVTLYDPQGFQVVNAINRFAPSSWMPFHYNHDGSFDLYFQTKIPAPVKEANWVPAPQESFNLTMRLYAPKCQALIGEWHPPAIIRAGEPAASQAH